MMRNLSGGSTVSISILHVTFWAFTFCYRSAPTSLTRCQPIDIEITTHHTTISIPLTLNTALLIPQPSRLIQHVHGSYIIYLIL